METLSRGSPPPHQTLDSVQSVAADIEPWARTPAEGSGLSEALGGEIQASLGGAAEERAEDRILGPAIGVSHKGESFEVVGCGIVGILAEDRKREVSGIGDVPGREDGDFVLVEGGNGRADGALGVGGGDVGGRPAAVEGGGSGECGALQSKLSGSEKVENLALMNEVGVAPKDVGFAVTVGHVRGQVVGGEVEELKEIMIMLPEIEQAAKDASAEANLHLFGEENDTRSAAPNVEGGTGVRKVMSVGVGGDAALLDNVSASVEGKKLPMFGHEEMEEDEGARKVEEEVNAQGDQFSAGDFVWGKIKSHPWWPGRVYDPSHASEYAAKYAQKGRLLVVYFGDRTFAWCLPSQLKPFHEVFPQMIEQSATKSFLAAVEEALDELGRSVKVKMVCSCVPSEERATLVKPSFVNPGIKEDVEALQGCIAEGSVGEFSPESFLKRIRDAALVVSSMNDLLEVTVFCSQVSAFRWVKGYGRLPVHNENPDASSCGDMAMNQVSENHKIDGQMVQFNRLQSGDDCITSLVDHSAGRNGRKLSQRGSKSLGDKHLQKKRSISELLQENMDFELEGDGPNMKEEDKVNAPSVKKQKKRKHASLLSAEAGGEDQSGNAPAGRKSASSSGMRKKSKHFASPSTELEINASAKLDNVDEGMSTSSRVRKKSKYLSPPYTMLDKLKGMASTKRSETGTLKAPRPSRVVNSMGKSGVTTGIPSSTEVFENGEETVDHKIGPPLLLKCSSESFQKNMSQSVDGEYESAGNPSPRTPKSNRKTTAPKENNASADDMLSEILSAALNPLYMKGNRSSNVVRAFFSNYRNMKYLSGYDFETYNKHVTDFSVQERKTPRTEHDSLSKSPRREQDFLGRDFREAKYDLLGKDLREANGSADKLGPIGEFIRSIPISAEKGLNKADRPVPKSGSQGKKAKRQPDGHVLVGISSIEGDQYGSGGRKRKSMFNEQFFWGKELKQADQSIPKSGSQGRKRKPQPNGQFMVGISSNAQRDGLVSVGIPSNAQPDGHILIGFPSNARPDGHVSAGIPSNAQPDRHVSVGITSHAKPDGHVLVGIPANGGDQSVLKPGAVHRKKKSRSIEHGYSKGDQNKGKSGQKKRKKDDKGSFPNIAKISAQATMEKMGPIDGGFDYSSIGTHPGEATGDNGVALLLTFASGFPLPSKKDLIKIFRKFGDLIESQTVVSRPSSSARVVYARSSDAEEAFNSTSKSNTLGPSFVNCQLQYLSRGPETNSGLHLPPLERGGTVTTPPKNAASGPPLRFIQQNLEIMMSMLSESAEKESSAEKLSPDVRANLAGEINGLLSKVTTLMGPSS